jgi:hypothetical protein
LPFFAEDRRSAPSFLTKPAVVLPGRVGAPPGYRPQNQSTRVQPGDGPANSPLSAALQANRPAPQPVRFPPAFRPSVPAAQMRPAGPPPASRISGSPPPVYRPQNQSAQKQRRPGPANCVQPAPAVYQPARKAVATPIVYRPNLAALLQRKPSIMAPPVYGPQAATMNCKLTSCKLTHEAAGRSSSAPTHQRGKIAIGTALPGRLTSPGNGLNTSIQLMKAKASKETYGEHLKSDVLNKLHEEDAIKTTRRLLLANAAIEYTRGKLSFGAGNVQEQIEKSSGRSIKLASDAQDLAGTMAQKIGGKDLSKANLAEDPSLNKVLPASNVPRQTEINAAACRAISAKWHGAGVCDDFAAVTFFYLQKQKKDVQDEFYRVSVSNNDLAHAVVIIADPGLNEAEIMNSATAVVADPWPTLPFAVRVSDWKYVKWAAKIKWSAADTGEHYIRTVRHVWKQPYVYGERKEKAYRGIGEEVDIEETPPPYLRVKQKVKELAKKSEEYTGQSHWHVWSDEHSWGE